MMRPKVPQPIAYCQYHGIELARENIEHRGCRNPERIAEGVCKHLIRYGPRERTGGARLTMRELHENIIQTLEENGMRLEGSRMCLVQELPDGGVLRFWWDEERRDKAQMPCLREKL